jgi:hypothetical protein
MEVSRFFSPPPGAMMRRNLLRGQRMFRQPVQATKHRPRGLPGKCPTRKQASRKHKKISGLNCMEPNPMQDVISRGN